MKKISIEEFVTSGYLQEANRLFFHRVGLALEVTVDDEGVYLLTGIWDCRDTGISFCTENPPTNRKEKVLMVKEELEKNSRVDQDGFNDDGIQTHTFE